MRRLLTWRWTKALLFVLCLGPLLRVGWRAWNQNLGANHHVFFRHASNDRTEMRTTNAVKGPGEDGPLPLKRVNDSAVS